MRIERLQGQDWHNWKHRLELQSATTSLNDNVRGLYKDKFNGKLYSHWMNDQEKEEYYAKTLLEASNNTIS